MMKTDIGSGPWRWWHHGLTFLVGSLVKLAIILLFVHDSDGPLRQGRWASIAGDTPEYVGPAESLIAHGVYAPDHRMPGFAAVYYVLRSCMAPDGAADGIVLLQFLLACATVYALAYAMFVHTGSRTTFLWSYALLVSATFSSRLETFLLTESFTTTGIVLHWVFFFFYCRRGRVPYLMASGLFLTWAIFLRPIYVGLFPIEALVLLMVQGTWRVRLGRVLLFLLPFLVIDGAWAGRNWRVHHAFHPLTNGLFNPEYSASPYYAMSLFLQGYGGKYDFWDPRSDLRWYGFRESQAGRSAPLEGELREPAPYVYTSAYDRDSLLALRDLVRISRDPERSLAAQDSATALIFQRTKAYREAFAREKPFQYHVMARLRMLKYLLVHSGSATLFTHPFAELGPVEKAMKLFQSFCYFVVMGIGLPGALFLVVRRWRRTELLVLGTIVLYGVFIHPFGMRLCEIRYLVPTYPLTLCVALLGIRWLIARWRTSRSGTLRTT